MLIDRQNMLMSGKRGVIMGLANKMSIAWGISKALADQGAELIFTYQGEALKKRVDPLAMELNSKMILECDVSNEDNIEKAFAEIEAKVGKIDFLVHSIAYSDKDQLKGRYVDTTKENFLQTMDVSCFSFTSVLKKAELIMNNNASVITLTYYGAERYMPHYNVMGVAKAALEASVRYLSVDLGAKPRGIRVNAISAGPLKTLAAAGIGDFRKIFKWNEENTPLRRNTTLEDVGGTAVYLLSSLSSGVTGEVIHVDSGYHVVGMKLVDDEEQKPSENIEKKD